MKQLIEPVRGRLHYDSIEFIAPSVRQYGDTAVLTYSLLTQGVRFDGGPATEGGWNTTNVYRYADGEWRIVHSHFARTTPAS